MKILNFLSRLKKAINKLTSINITGTITATNFVGNGSGLTDINYNNSISNFINDVVVGNGTKLSTFLDRVLTIGSVTSGNQGGVELIGNIVSDTVISAIGFHNQASSTTDKRVGAISSVRYGDDSAGRISITVWSATDTPVNVAQFNPDGLVGKLLLTAEQGIDCQGTIENTSGDLTLDASGNIIVDKDTFFNQPVEFKNSSKFDNLIINSSTVPSSASDTGTQGQMIYDSNYLYVCVATNTWKRIALSTW